LRWGKTALGGKSSPARQRRHLTLIDGSERRAAVGIPRLRADAFAEAYEGYSPRGRLDLCRDAESSLILW